MSEGQADLFGKRANVPAGFRYQPELLTEAGERELIQHIEPLDFAPFEFHGFLGKRRVVSFGWRYDFGGGGLQEVTDLPAFLLPIRSRAAAIFGSDPTSFRQALVTESAPGAPIGWHKAPLVFGSGL